jgi:thiaminase/transcriptional activator TenA
LKQFGVDPARVAATEPSPDCLGYTSYLLATAYHDPYEVLLAALLPCFWLYWDVGKTIAAKTAAGNPYQAWIDTYSDDGYGAAVQRVIDASDRAAAGASAAVRRAMDLAFVRSTRWEYLFWDGAYKMRAWPDIE